MSRLADAHIVKTKALHSATRRSDSARAKIAAIGMPATSAIVATHAIHDAWSADTEKAPAMSAISRSTSCEEMLEPTMAIAITPIDVIATDSDGWAASGCAVLAPEARSLITGPSSNGRKIDE
jgi:hypothetical protein